jgi:DNA polymerase
LKGIIPRSYFVHRDSDKVTVLIVSKNPGQSPPWEQQIYRGIPAEHRANAHLEMVEKLFTGHAQASSRYFANLLDWMAIVLDVPASFEQVFRHAAMTALVKCQSAGNAHVPLPGETLRTCANRHLFREIELLQPKMLIALSSEIYRYLLRPDVRQRHKLPVGQMWHPSWTNMPGGVAAYKEGPLKALRREYLAALCT